MYLICIYIYIYIIYIYIYIYIGGSLRLPTPPNTDPSRISATIRDIKKLYIHELFII